MAATTDGRRINSCWRTQRWRRRGRLLLKNKVRETTGQGQGAGRGREDKEAEAEEAGPYPKLKNQVRERTGQGQGAGRRREDEEAEAEEAGPYPKLRSNVRERTGQRQGAGWGREDEEAEAEEAGGVTSGMHKANNTLAPNPIRPSCQPLPVEYLTGLSPRRAQEKARTTLGFPFPGGRVWGRVFFLNFLLGSLAHAYERSYFSFSKVDLALLLTLCLLPLVQVMRQRCWHRCQRRTGRGC